MMDNAEKRIGDAMAIGLRYGQNDGAHHKTWVIDQMIRVLAGDRYDEIIARTKAGEDGPETYGWDCGTPP